MKPAITSGVYLGLIGILISVIIWAGGLMESMGIWGSALIGIFNFVITFLLIFFFSKSYRNKFRGGFISFKDIFIYSLIMVIASVVIGAIYNLVFFTLIDPGYTERLMGVMQQKTITYMERVGAPESQINKTMEKFSEVPSTAKSIINGLVGGLIIGAILALISSAFVKKNPDIESENAYR